MMVYRRPRGRQKSRVAIPAAVMLLGTGVSHRMCLRRAARFGLILRRSRARAKLPRRPLRKYEHPLVQRPRFPPVAEFDHSGSTGARWAEGVDPTCGRAPEL